MTAALAMDTPQSDLAERLAHELAVAAGIAEDCQGALSDLIENGISDESMIACQSLDALTQHLVELAKLFHRLKPLKGVETIDPSVFSAIRLADLRDRLTAVEPADTPMAAEVWAARG